MDLTLTAGQVSVGRNLVVFGNNGSGWFDVFLISLLCVCVCVAGLRGAPGYSLDQAHHLPIEMDSLIGGFEKRTRLLHYITKYINIILQNSCG